jgi:hypothetical protein
MMRSSFIVAGALASGVFAHSAADALSHGKAESGSAMYASTHEFHVPKKRLDGTGKMSAAPWMAFRNRDCIGLGMFFSILSDVAVRLECRSGDGPQLCGGELFDPACGAYRGPPTFYLCKSGACVEQRGPAKP